MQLPSKFQIGDMVAFSTAALIARPDMPMRDPLGEYRVDAVVFEEDGPRYRLQRKMADQRTGPADRRQRNLGAGFQDASGGFGLRTTAEAELVKLNGAADPS